MALWWKDRKCRCSLSSKNSYILEKNHYFTKLIIGYHHKLVKHNGVRETLNSTSTGFHRVEMLFSNLFLIAAYAERMRVNLIHIHSTVNYQKKGFQRNMVF